jgi:hypothetical protein
MGENKEDYYSLSEIVNFLKSFFYYLRRKWLLVLLAIMAGAGLGVGYYFMQKPKYVAITTFILEEKGTEGGGLAGLASQFGANIGLGGGSIFSGDNIFDILQSKKIVKQVLLSKLADSGANSLTLADMYMDFMGMRKKWQNNPKLAGINFTDAAAKTLSPLQDSILTAFYEAIIRKSIAVERLNKKGSIIKVEVTASNDVFARLMSIRLVNEASKLYMDIRTGASQANIVQLQRRSDSLLVLLNRKSFTAAASVPLDINPALITATVPGEIANRDKTVLATLYAEVTKNLETSKLLLSQQMPVIQILDQPDNSLHDNKMSLFLLMIISVFLSIFVCLFIISVLYLSKSFGRR